VYITIDNCVLNCVCGCSSFRIYTQCKECGDCKPCGNINEESNAAVNPVQKSAVKEYLNPPGPRYL